MGVVSRDPYFIYEIFQKCVTVDAIIRSNELIQYKIGNLIEAEEPIIVHGCNAQGRMASGVAKAIRERWPGAFDAYRLEYEKNGLTLGSVVWYRTPENKIIANAITQEFYGRDGRRYVDYDAVRKAFREIASFAKGQNLKVAMPMIGAGLGGGEWSLIENLVELSFEKDSVTVYQL